MKIKIYTDGACSGNPGAGGWGAVVCLPEKTIKLSGYEADTTNNRMELSGVINGLKTVSEMIYQEEIESKQIDLEIVSDSAYVINAINQRWLEFWKNNDYVNSKGVTVKNKDLWLILDNLLHEMEFISVPVVFTKIKGHAGHPMNELADRLAVNEYKKHIGG